MCTNCMAVHIAAPGARGGGGGGNCFLYFCNPQILKKVKAELAEIVRKEGRFVSGAVDVWESIAHDSYLGFIVRWITDDFELRTTTLGIFHFPGSAARDPRWSFFLFLFWKHCLFCVCG